MKLFDPRYFSKLIHTGILLCTISTAVAQIGMGNTDPKAALDISASNSMSPTTTDGLLIPRIDAFSATNPTIDQNGMLVFLTTTIGVNLPGFYYWDNTASAWVTINSTTGVPANIIQDTDADTKIQVEESADEDIIRFDIAGAEILNITRAADGSPIFDLNNTSVNLGNNISTAGNPFNVVLGNNAGTTMSGAQQNVFIGSGAGRFVTDGDFNTTLGFQSGTNLTTGAQNTFIGMQAGGDAQSGNSNTYIGFYTGRNATGSNNVFVGYAAGENETTSSKLYIDNSGTTSPLIYGEFDTNLLRVNGTLDINNAFQFPTTDGTSGQVLATDGSGIVAWTTAPGDDLGDHSATQDIILGSNLISNTANNNGIKLDTNGGLSSKGDNAFLQFEDAPGNIFQTIQSTFNPIFGENVFKFEFFDASAFLFATPFTIHADGEIQVGSAGTGFLNVADGIMINSAQIEFADGTIQTTATTFTDVAENNTTAVIGGNTGIETVNITFTETFTTVPKLQLTVNSGNATEMYIANTVSVTTTGATVTVYRLDTPGGTINNAVSLEWIAWE